MGIFRHRLLMQNSLGYIIHQINDERKIAILYYKMYSSKEVNPIDYIIIEDGLDKIKINHEDLVPDGSFNLEQDGSGILYYTVNNPDITECKILIQFNKNASDLSHLFEYCYTIKQISDNLFINCINVTNLSYCFASYEGFSNYLSEIPKNLFKNCIKVNNYSYCFYRCKNLTKIPEYIFSNLSLDINFNNIFENTGITELNSIYFNNLSGNCTFEFMFSGIPITTISGKIFNNCNSTNIENIFFGCYNLTDVNIDLFKTCNNLQNASGIFINCVNLKNIPNDLFKSNYNISEFAGCFSNCENLLNSPSDPCYLWERTQELGYTVPSGLNCFNNCYNLSNFEEIPENWKTLNP